jgi:RNA polymerase sigma-70 factor, ECF subfamily
MTDADPRPDGRIGHAIARAQAGDVNALHFLYVRYADDVYGYVNNIVHDDHDAEDITQDVFAKLPPAIRRYEQREVPFAGWLLRVARNAALDHLRSRSAALA